MASTYSNRILKSHYVAEDTYTVSPRASRHDRAHAIALIRDATTQADAIVSAARDEAQALLEEAATEREAQLEALRTHLLEEARQTVRDQLQREADETFARFQMLVENAVMARAEMRAACHADTLAIAVAIAEQVIGREIERDRTTVERIADLAMSQVQLEQVLQIQVHPGDYAVMDKWAAQVFGAQRSAIEIVTDPGVGAGGCVIGTKMGFVDARIETQLAVIRKALADVVEHA